MSPPGWGRAVILPEGPRDAGDAGNPKEGLQILLH